MATPAEAGPRAVEEREKVTWGVCEPLCAGFEGFLRRQLQSTAAQQVCDVGGGANPLVPLKYLKKHGIACTVFDLSAKELAKAPVGYRTKVGDVAASDFASDGERFDAVFSRMLAEHVCDGEQFHRNVREMLRPGGVAVHCFPTLYAVPFLVNWALPVKAADRLLAWVQPRDRYRHAKFPAHYDWCRGPSQRQLERLEGVGYEVLEYRGLFGHSYYGERGPLAWGNRRMAEWLTRHPVAAMTSYAYVALRRV